MRLIHFTSIRFAFSRRVQLLRLKHRRYVIYDANEVQLDELRHALTSNCPRQLVRVEFHAREYRVFMNYASELSTRNSHNRIREIRQFQARL
jgi:hypothetical protein